MDEQWKDIYFTENGKTYDYRGLYQISNLGNIRSLDREVWNGYGYFIKNGEMKKPTKKSNGYLHITLYKNGSQKTFHVHRLVAHMWIVNDDVENKIYVDHIDADKTNNVFTNLHWTTQKENLENPITKSKTYRDEKGVFRSVLHA